MFTKAIRTNCIVEFKKAFFTGTYRKPKFSHESRIKGKVLRHSYGEKRGQHTFTIEVISCDTDDYNEGDKFRIKGRNLYPNIISHVQGEESLKDSK